MSARALLSATLVASATFLSACGSSARVSDQVRGRTLTIYSSLPLQGASSPNGLAALHGEQLALEQLGGRVGRYRLILRSLDDATPQRGQWDPGQSTLNAKLALKDATTIGYLGDLNSGASAVAIPLLNRLGIVQLAPAATSVGLTSSGPGASPGEPQKYYPTGTRTFARVMPSDAVQAAVQVRIEQAAGCRATYVLDDGEVDGQDMADTFTSLAVARGLQVPLVTEFDPRASDYTPLVASLARSGARCVLISAIDESGAALLSGQLASGLPAARLFASATLADSEFTGALGRTPAAAGPRLLITVPAQGGSVQARSFLSAYSRRYGPPEPDAIYGYEAMSLLLGAIDGATDHGTRPARRSAVREQVFATRSRRSALGSFGIDPEGDSTLSLFGVDRVAAGRLAPWRVLSSG